MAVTFAVIGDIHGALERLDTVLEHIAGGAVDGILLVGDVGAGMFLAEYGTPQQVAERRRSVEQVLGRVEEVGVPVLWVPGNHDAPDTLGEGNVDRRVIDVSGVRIAGIGGSGPNRFGFSYEWDDDDIRALDLPPYDLLISHTPPRDTPLDRTVYEGVHAGSAAIRERAEELDGVLVCGHIHEAAGLHQLACCLGLNAGSLGEPHVAVRVGFVSHDAARSDPWEVRLDNLEDGSTASLRRSAAVG